MSNDEANHGSMSDAAPAVSGLPATDGHESRPADVNLARAQIDAARARQRQLIATGKLAPAASSNRESMINSLPGYMLVRELHRGGQGVVYLAVQNSTGRQVAIKLLNRELPPGAGSAGLALPARRRFSGRKPRASRTLRA